MHRRLDCVLPGPSRICAKLRRPARLFRDSETGRLAGNQSDSQQQAENLIGRKFGHVRGPLADSKGLEEPIGCGSIHRAADPDHHLLIKPLALEDEANSRVRDVCPRSVIEFPFHRWDPLPFEGSFSDDFKVLLTAGLPTPNASQDFDRISCLWVIVVHDHEGLLAQVDVRGIHLDRASVGWNWSHHRADFPRHVNGVLTAG